MELTFKINPEDPRRLSLLLDGQLWKTVCKFLFFRGLKKFPSGLALEEFTLLEQKISKRYVLALLSKKAFLSTDLAIKLREKGFSPPVIEEVLIYCQERGYTDDSQELSRLISRERKKGKSIREIHFKLRQKKGVNTSLLRALIEGDSHSESAALELSLSKYSKKMSSKEEMRKVAQKLCRKGFSPELVFKRLQLI